MAKRLIALDPGHGGTDPGAVGNGFKEKDLTLTLTRNVADHLQSMGFDVFITRTDDNTVPLIDRTNRINAAKPDVSLSIHINSAALAQANGIEIYSYPDAVIDKRFAATIWDQVKNLGFTNRGVKTKNLHMLREVLPNIPAALIEVGFIKNKADMDRLLGNLQGVSIAIAKGIANYLGPVDVPTPTPPATPLTVKAEIKTHLDAIYKLIEKL